MELETQTPFVEMGTYQDEDELYLKQLSVYATIRPGDLKRDSLGGLRSTNELLALWRQRNGEIESDTETTTDEVELESVDLQEHELGVRGFEVDSRIAPGFRYLVRYIGQDEYLFDGRAKRLESIGLGYGRRLTFQGETLNNNENYFWSDSSPEGFAFNIEAVKEDDCFIVTDADSQVVGNAVVEKAYFPQIERDTIVEDNAVVKHVHVKFMCSIKSLSNDHTYINLNIKDFEFVEGTAELVKEKGAKEAYVRCVHNVYFQKFGMCRLHQEA